MPPTDVWNPTARDIKHDLRTYDGEDIPRDSLLDINRRFARIEPEARDAVVVQLTERDLEQWVGEIHDGDDGLTEGERGSLYTMFARDLGPEQLVRVHDALDKGDRGLDGDERAALFDTLADKIRAESLFRMTQAFGDRGRREITDAVIREAPEGTRVGIVQQALDAAARSEQGSEGLTPADMAGNPERSVAARVLITLDGARVGDTESAGQCRAVIVARCSGANTVPEDVSEGLRERSPTRVPHGITDGLDHG